VTYLDARARALELFEPPFHHMNGYSDRIRDCLWADPARPQRQERPSPRVRKVQEGPRRGRGERKTMSRHVLVRAYLEQTASTELYGATVGEVGHSGRRPFVLEGVRHEMAKNNPTRAVLDADRTAFAMLCQKYVKTTG